MSGASNCRGEETLPAASIRRMSRISPLAWAGDRVMLKLPVSVTRPVPSKLPKASRTCTVAPGSPLPLRVTPSAKATPVGWAGACKSGVTTDAGAEALPLASVSTTCRLLPSFTGGSRVIWKVPSGLTEPLASTLPWASRTCTLAPASPRPLSWAPARPTTKLVAASGGVVSPPSMSGAVMSPAVEVLPAASVAVTCSTSPLTCGGSRVMLKLPVASTTTLPSTVVPSAASTRTVLPTSARPVTSLPLALIASSLGVTGGVMSGAAICTGRDEAPVPSMATTSSSSPLAWAGLRMTVKVPPAPTTTLPTSVPLASCTSTRLPVGAVPVMLVPFAATTRSLGLAGVVVAGTSYCRASEALPLASVCTRLNCSPGCAAGVRSTKKVPLAPTVAVPMTEPLASRTCTVAPASPRPLSTRPSAPTTTLLTAAGGVTSGAVNASGVELLPAASTTRMSRASPLAWAGNSVTLKVPSSLTKPVPIRLPVALRTCTVAPGSPRPVKVTPSTKASSVGCAGASRSGAATEPGCETLPAVSVRVTCRVLPSVMAGFKVMAKVPSGLTVPVATTVPASSRT